MKKIVKIVSVIAILFMLLISTSYATGLTVDVNEKALETITTSLEKPLNTETINTDVFLFEDNASIENDVNGNIYAVGENINISSKNIDGDVFVLGEEVTINSNVTGNVFVLANNLNISGTMRDVLVLTENINLKENTTCRDFKVIGSNINVEGIVNRDLYAASGDVNLSGTGKVGGTLSTVNDNLINKENVNEIQIIEDAFADFENIDDQLGFFAENMAKAIIVLLFIASEMIGLLIIAFIVIFTSKNQINTSELKEHGIKDTLYGLLYYIIVIIISIILMFTIIGIPLSIFILFVLWFVCAKLAIPVASIQFTKAILKQENKSKVLVWFVAFLIFTLIQATIFIQIGGLVKGIVALYGFGYMIRSILRKNKKEAIEQVEII